MTNSQANTGHNNVQLGVAQAPVTIFQWSAGETTPAAESDLQARFLKDTGIACGKPARAQMELLMDQHGFTARHLCRAWKSGALIWDPRVARLRVSSRTFDLVVGWSGVAAFTFAWLIGMAMSIGVFGKPGHQFVSLAAAGGCLAWAASLAMMMFVFIWPQHIAKQAEQALRSCSA